MQKKLAARGFTVVSVSPDAKVEEAGAFAKEIKATFPVVHDAKMTVFEKFGALGLPANVVIGRNGKVLASIEGDNIKAVQAAVAKAMAAK
jgi:peroxiredoxin